MVRLCRGKTYRLAHPLLVLSFYSADESVTLREAFDTLALLRMPGSKSIPLNFHQKGQLDTMPMEVALQVRLVNLPGNLSMLQIEQHRELHALLLLQAILSQCPSLYLFEELMNAFAMFAEAAGPIGCITYKALKQALVRCWICFECCYIVCVVQTHTAYAGEV